MKGMLARRRGDDLAGRLAALEEALRLAEGRLDPSDVTEGLTILARAGERLGLGPELTVVALAGATGSGKSSLFNALVGDEVSTVGVRRPTTGVAHAAVWGHEDGAGPLLDWLQVPLRHQKPGLERELDGLVLLDLPDHDSTETSHRLEVDRLVELVDLLVWVVDPQKYADAALHHRYLRRLAGHQDVMLIAMNHVDRLGAADRRACLGGLRDVLEDDGLRDVRLLATSARTGEGIPELRSLLSRLVAERRAAAARLEADVRSIAGRLAGGCSEPAGRSAVGKRERDAVLAAMGEAAGVPLVREAVARSHLHRASLATGWPFARWVRRFRPDPLARLHLGRAGRRKDLTGVPRTSLPPPSPLQRARLGTAIRDLADSTAGHLPAPWPAIVRRRVTSGEEDLPDLLDRVVSGTDLDVEDSPGWWRVVGVLQMAFAALAVAGALWLMVLFVVGWFLLPEPPTPELREVPIPTWLMVGGLVAGLLVSIVGRRFARIGAGRRGRRARRRLDERLSVLAQEQVLGPVEEELATRERLCEALGRAGRAA